MWVKARALRDGGFKGYCEDIPVKQGQTVRIPKGTQIKSTDPSNKIKVAQRTYKVKVVMVCRGSTLGIDPSVSWGGQHGYWCDAMLDDIEVERTGDDLPASIYPGHPLTLALYAMYGFESAKKALAPTEHGFCELVGSSKVPGAGGNAYAAADLLRKLHSGELALKDALDWADERWGRQVLGTAHEKDYDPGKEQAHSLFAEFLSVADKWDWR